MRIIYLKDLKKTRILASKYIYREDDNLQSILTDRKRDICDSLAVASDAHMAGN
jgi:hypothetical protein